jgi:hypothetical protein
MLPLPSSYFTLNTHLRQGWESHQQGWPLVSRVFVRKQRSRLPHQWLVATATSMLSSQCLLQQVAGSLMCALKAHAERCQKPSTTHHQAHPCSLGSYAAHLLMMPHHSNLRWLQCRLHGLWGLYPSLILIQACPASWGWSSSECKSTMLYRHPIKSLQCSTTRTSQKQVSRTYIQAQRIRTSTFRSQNKVQIVSQSVLFLVLSVLRFKNPALDVRYGSPILVPLVQGGVHHATPREVTITSDLLSQNRVIQVPSGKLSTSTISLLRINGTFPQAVQHTMRKALPVSAILVLAGTRPSNCNNTPAQAARVFHTP